jgi:hypothetical protein
MGLGQRKGNRREAEWRGLPRISTTFFVRVDGYAEVKEEFYVSSALGVGTTIDHPSIESGERAVDFPDVEQLWTLGLISMTPESSPMSGRLYPTADGIHHVEEVRRLESITRADDAISSGSGASRIAWDTTLPVLQAEMVEGRA